MIPFNKIHLTGKEHLYISEAMDSQISGDGKFTKKCSKWLEDTICAEKVLLTHSCTAALEMAAILINIQPGDEVIIPSFTFVSTANAFVLRGAIPVFVDININNLNIDVEKIEKAITKKTKAIIPVHYAGNSCDMRKISEIAKAYGLFVIEDAAQSILSFQNGKHNGSVGDLSTFSFHQTKNITCGEGGALVINNPKLSERAEIIREKGTNRSAFLNKKTSLYTWIDIGSSYLINEISAAFLWAQLQEAKNITSKRLQIWQKYKNEFSEFENNGKLKLQKLSKNSKINAHIFYILLKDKSYQQRFIDYMNKNLIQCLTHYVPLHNSPYGKKISKIKLPLEVTESVSNRLVRLPIWIGLDNYQKLIIQRAKEFLVSI